jgi:hypothetical protein
MKRPGLFFFALIVGLNLGHSPHGWIYDRAYDACMATAGDDDWKCEDFMPNPIKPGPRQPALGAVVGSGQRASELT